VAGDALEDEDAAAEEGAGKADEGAQVCVVFFRMCLCLLSVCLARLCLSAHTRSSTSLVGALPNWYTHRVVRSPRRLKGGLIPN
jgi:hypothetical protein